MKKVSQREFEVNYFEKEGEKEVWIAESHLVDEPHDITVTVEVDMEHMVIKDANIKFNRYPLEHCPLIEQKAAQLVGLRVDRYFSQNVLKIFMGPEGCPNIMLLLSISIPGIMYYYFPHKMKMGEITREQWFEMLMKEERNACLAHTLLFGRA